MWVLRLDGVMSQGPVGSGWLSQRRRTASFSRACDNILLAVAVMELFGWLREDQGR